MNYVFRFGAVPMMLFSGTFFPVSRLPGWLQPIAYATPLWHGVALCRGLSLGTGLSAWSVAAHVGYLVAITAAGLWAGSVTYRRRLYV
jgi:lipooligosaccharide transport system permease protein